MGYLGEMYGKRSPDFVKGLIAGLIEFAWWADGVQYVGTCSTTLRTAIDDAIRELAENPEDFPSADEIVMKGFI